MANITVTVTDVQQLALDEQMVSVTEWANNAVHEKARISSIDILAKLLTHCNANSITMATGEAAQLQQAYDLNVIQTAVARNDETPV
jgi:aspartate carbamoyltransferase regulatory subunit